MYCFAFCFVIELDNVLCSSTKTFLFLWLSSGSECGWNCFCCDFYGRALLFCVFFKAKQKIRGLICFHERSFVKQGSLMDFLVCNRKSNFLKADTWIRTSLSKTWKKNHSYKKYHSLLTLIISVLWASPFCFSRLASSSK